MKISIQTLLSLVGICSWCTWVEAGTVSIVLTPAEVDVRENDGGAFDILLNNTLTLPNSPGAPVSVPIQLTSLTATLTAVAPIIDETDTPIDMMIKADPAAVKKVDASAVPVTDPTGKLSFTTPGGAESLFQIPKQTGFHFTLEFKTDQDLPELPIDHQLWQVGVIAEYGYTDLSGTVHIGAVNTTSPGSSGGMIDVSDLPEPNAFVIWSLVMGIFGAGSLRMRLKRNKTAA
jgi:hypothetical protein